ncbi:unnamed protein product [Paramecium pentaurelia]|uniref:Uncharacterized protein n=1 Tax=Paramecium pentaurelia TaxID=43138 RepID=A0A8S1T811_9CILI|nr:unnamed protein product [Paramecium pentaurelia]
MNNEFVKMCSITQNKEEYICMNEQCCTSNRKQVQCYECITKIHRQNNNNFVNHIDDFKKISLIMEEVEKRKKDRINFINQTITSMNDFKKEKFQIIESYQNNPKEFLDQVKSYVENEIAQFIQKLFEQIMEMNKLTEYQQQYHSSILKLYQQTINFYIEDITQKKQQLQIKINNYIQKMDLDLHQQISKYLQKQQVLEQQSKQLIQRPSITNQLSFKSIIVLILIIALNQIIIFQYFNGKSELQQYMDNFQFIVNELQSEMEQKRDSLFYEFKIELQQQMNKMKDQIDILNQKVNQTETPFNQFKNHFNSKLKQYNETIYNIIFETVNLQTKSIKQIQEQLIIQNQLNEKIFADNNRTSSILYLQQLRVIKNEEDFKIFNKNSNLNFESVQRQKTQLMNNIMKIHKRIQIQNKEKINEKLIGKIHVNLNVKDLENFIIIYDELFTKVLNRQVVQYIQKITNNDTIICVGGMKVENPEVLLVAGCDYQQEIFQFTYHWQHARKSQQGDIHWYMVYQVAFGFSPTEEISLTLCDDLDSSDLKRFSYWFENGEDGGRRIGNQIDLKNSIEYKMVMYAL